MSTEREKMVAGELYDPGDAELCAERARAQRFMKAYNATTVEDGERRRPLLEAHLGAVGARCSLRAPLYVDYGWNVFLEDGVFMNYACVLLDVCPIRIGAGTQIGPGVQLYAADHPRDPTLALVGPGKRQARHRRTRRLDRRRRDRAARRHDRRRGDPSARAASSRATSPRAPPSPATPPGRSDPAARDARRAALPDARSRRAVRRDGGADARRAPRAHRPADAVPVAVPATLVALAASIGDHVRPARRNGGP